VAVFASVALLVVGGTPTASAAAPAGPRLAFGMWKTNSKPMELLLESIGADGFNRHTLAGRGRIWPAPFDGGSWAPDGSLIAFAGAPRGTEPSKYRIYLASADGGRLDPVAGTGEGHDPVFSPNGTEMAFSRTRLRQGKIDLKTTHSHRRRLRQHDGVDRRPRHRQVPTTHSVAQRVGRKPLLVLPG
jgi:hypothetical protein